MAAFREFRVLRVVGRRAGRAQHRKTRNYRNANMSYKSSDSGGGRPFRAPLYVEKVGVYGLYVPPTQTRGRADRLPWTTRPQLRAYRNSKFTKFANRPEALAHPSPAGPRWSPTGLAGRRTAALPGSEGPVKPFRTPQRDAIPRSCAVPSLFLASNACNMHSLLGTKAGKWATPATGRPSHRAATTMFTPQLGRQGEAIGWKSGLQSPA
jgi:hypothetical protein